MPNKNKFTNRCNLQPRFIRFEAEQQYARKLRRLKKDYIYQPTVQLSVGIFHPDFYLVADDIYVEIVGSRQAYHLAKRKIKIFHRQYGKNKLLVLDRNGDPYPRCPSPVEVDDVLRRTVGKIENYQMENQLRGEDIRHLRKKLGLTQTQFAELLGLSTCHTISYWENEAKGYGPGIKYKTILIAMMQKYKIIKKCEACNSVYFGRGASI